MKQEIKKSMQTEIAKTNFRYFFISEKFENPLIESVIKESDLVNFLNETIHTCQEDYILLFKDTCFFPLNMADMIQQCIKKANDEFGEGSWAIIGNYGLEFLSEKILKYKTDSQTAIIPSGSPYPRFASYLDGDVILLNIKNIRKNNIAFPPVKIDLRSSDIFLILLCEAYKNNLICAIDSKLYAKDIDERKKIAHQENDYLAEYWRNNYINNSIKTISGTIEIENDLNYLKQNAIDKRADFYENIRSAIFNIYREREKKTIFILIRTRLNRPNQIRRLLDSIEIANAYYRENINIAVILSVNNYTVTNPEMNISELKKTYKDISFLSFVLNEPFEYFPRVSAIKGALKLITESKNNFIWIVDDDDFIYPDAFAHIPFFLNDKSIFLGNSFAFKEKWDKDSDTTFPIESKKKMLFDTSLYYNFANGNNPVPMCSIIFPAQTLKNIFNKYALKGDYYEDYALFILAQKNINVNHYPILIAGISYHGLSQTMNTNVDKWNSSYATFISEIVNCQIIDEWTENFINEQKNEIAQKNQIIADTKRELHAIKISLQWRIPNFFYRLYVNHIQTLFVKKIENRK